MTYQRTRGPLVTYYPRMERRTERGVVQYATDRDHPKRIHAALSEVTGASRAEGGRDQIEILHGRVRLAATVTGLGPGAEFVINGQVWEVISPPEAHDSPHPASRHATVAVRSREQVEPLGPTCTPANAWRCTSCGSRPTSRARSRSVQRGLHGRAAGDHGPRLANVCGGRRLTA